MQKRFVKLKEELKRNVLFGFSKKLTKSNYKNFKENKIDLKCQKRNLTKPIFVKISSSWRLSIITLSNKAPSFKCQYTDRYAECPNFIFVMLSVIKLSSVMLICHYANCYQAECHGVKALLMEDPKIKCQMAAPIHVKSQCLLLFAKNCC